MTENIVATCAGVDVRIGACIHLYMYTLEVQNEHLPVNFVGGLTGRLIASKCTQWVCKFNLS